MKIKESLEYLGFSDILELSLKCSLYKKKQYERELFILDRENNGKNIQEKIVVCMQIRELCSLHGKLTIFTWKKFIVINPTENGSNRCASSYNDSL